MNDLILKELSVQFCEMGKDMGFSNTCIRSNRYTSEIYIIKEHALQIEIDWREYDLFMYIVYLKNHALPDDRVIYRYDDGHWCRIYMEDIYRTKRPNVKDRTKRYSPEYLFECMDFYKKLIKENPQILIDFYDSIDVDK